MRRRRPGPRPARPDRERSREPREGSHFGRRSVRLEFPEDGHSARPGCARGAAPERREPAHRHSDSALAHVRALSRYHGRLLRPCRARLLAAGGLERLSSGRRRKALCTHAYDCGRAGRNPRPQRRRAGGFSARAQHLGGSATLAGGFKGRHPEARRRARARSRLCGRKAQSREHALRDD